jgi:hypothetical protein
MAYNTAERDTIILCIALEAIADIANHELIELREVASLPGVAEVHFQSRVHQQLFLIRLLDFVKENGDQTLTGVAGSCLDALRTACENKSFDHDGSIASLKEATRTLNDWLTSKTPLRLWLPTLDLEAHLDVPRLDFLYISGNQVKHNLSRLTGLTKRIAQTLKNHGHDVPIEHVLLALDDFREQLEEDYFVYYGTWLAELLNNIRWGLQEYLLPTFRSSYTIDPNDRPRYTYKYPDSITNEVARAWFWRLMNNVRKEPYLKRFAGAHYMKKDVLR